MHREIQEPSSSPLSNGVRTVVLTSSDAADRVKIELRITHQEEVSLSDESPRYEVTGNLTPNGRLADELIQLAAVLNRHRILTRIP